VYTYEGGAAPVDAGTTGFTVTCSGTNFVTATATASIGISTAPVTATAGSGSATYDGLSQSPSSCVVSGAYTGDLSCTNSPASVGPGAATYGIAPQVTGTGLANFTITLVDRSYTINPKPAAATATPVTGVYNGSPYTGSGTCSDGLAPVVTYAGGVAPVDAGTTGFTVTCSGPNLVPAAATASIAISKATPVFSGLSGPTITAGTTPTTLAGTLKAGSLIPSGNVSITLNGVTQEAAITATGAFSSSFATGALPAAGSPYMITYSYAGNGNFASAGPDASQRLTVQPTYTLFGLQNVPPAASIVKAKAGSSVPMKWQFKNGSTVVNSAGVIHQVTITSASFSNTDSGGSSFRYDATTNTWSFNLQTKSPDGVPYPAVTYTVTIKPVTAGYLPSQFTLVLSK